MTTTYRAINKASEQEQSRMVDVLTDSFLTYSAHVDMWGPERERTHGLMVQAVAHNLAGHETWVAEREGEIVAVALWVPAGSTWLSEEDTERVFGPVLATIPPEMGEWLVGVAFPGFVALANTVSPNCSTEWAYLAMFGVDPKYQGKGIGSGFLQHERARIAGPIGLATQTEDNIRFYEKNGFKVRADKMYTLPNGKPWHDRFLVSDPPAS